MARVTDTPTRATEDKCRTTSALLLELVLVTEMLLTSKVLLEESQDQLMAKLADTTG